MSSMKSLPFIVRDEVFYLLQVNNIIIVCEIGILDCNQYIIDFTGDQPFWRQYYQHNPYEYIKYKLGNEGDFNDPDDILLRVAELGILVAVQEALKKGADIHAINDKAVRMAARNGYLDLV